MKSENYVLERLKFYENQLTKVIAERRELNNKSRPAISQVKTLEKQIAVLSARIQELRCVLDE